ncbi:MAG: hypothetical protein MUF12_01820 [Sediminibacterium sp.]|jgi:hypothetical protein|nr:hypothetical protein [Sediminibacterium sp.]
MKTEAKIALGIGVVALGFGTAFILKMKRLSEELETTTTAMIHKVNLTGIELKVEVTLKNPTQGTMRIKQPFVKLLYKDRVFATSEVKNSDIEIPKFGQINIEPIFIRLGFISLASIAPDLLKEYRSIGKLDLVVKTITTINDKVPYTKTDTIQV